MTDDELIAKAEKELASLTRCMSPDKVAKLEAHRLISLARIGAGEMAGERPSENEIKLHNYDAALRNIAGGHFANASTLAINGEWHEAYGELQKIAKAALSAARITELQADYKDCREELQIEQDRVLELERQLAEAREALKPFADEANSERLKRLALGPDIDDWPIKENSLTLGDLRRAARVIGRT